MLLILLLVELNAISPTVMQQKYFSIGNNSETSLASPHINNLAVIVLLEAYYSIISCFCLWQAAQRRVSFRWFMRTINNDNNKTNMKSKRLLCQKSSEIGFAFLLFIENNHTPQEGSV